AARYGDGDSRCEIVSRDRRCCSRARVKGDRLPSGAVEECWGIGDGWRRPASRLPSRSPAAPGCARRAGTSRFDSGALPQPARADVSGGDRAISPHDPAGEFGTCGKGDGGLDRYEGDKFFRGCRRDPFLSTYHHHHAATSPLQLFTNNPLATNRPSTFMTSTPTRSISVDNASPTWRSSSTTALVADRHRRYTSVLRSRTFRLGSGAVLRIQLSTSRTWSAIPSISVVVPRREGN